MASVDSWSPFIFGAVGTMCHVKHFPALKAITKSYDRYLVRKQVKHHYVVQMFLFSMALFGSLGYEGGLGIIVGSIVLVASLFAVISFLIVKDDHASLELSLGFNAIANIS